MKWRGDVEEGLVFCLVWGLGCFGDSGAGLFRVGRPPPVAAAAGPKKYVLIRRLLGTESVSWIEAGVYGLLGILLLLGAAWEAAPSPPPLSPRWYDDKGNLLHSSLSADGKWRFPPNEATIRRVAPLLLYKEDKAFWYHIGVNPFALVRALGKTLLGERQGGSTLTMQLARLWRPGPRTLGRKLKEIFWAFGLELRYTKEDILRFYLTYAPFGGNIEGIEAAALRYFGKGADRLTPLEIASLLLVSQRPRLRRSFEKGEPGFREQALGWVHRWYQAGFLSAAVYQQAISTYLRPKRHSCPRLESHVLPPIFSSTDTLYIENPLQQEVRRRLLRYLHFWRTCGIQEGAVLIAEVTTGKVRAYVPSSAYSSCAIDLIRSPRAVGSTLKPFLWSEALEQGIIHSETPLLDWPRDYRGYTPVNFQRREYKGLVSASKALFYSLNAPAVDLLGQVGLESFFSTMEALGIVLSRKGGYAVIVGAAEASLFNIVQAYTALASGGVWIRLRRKASDSPEKRIVWGKGGPWIVRGILCREDGWSYKTGTSAQLRDAWCIAYDSRYVVGVWIGNPDASPSGCLKGSLVALPLAQEITALLGEGKKESPPFCVERVRICPLTGHRIGESCSASLEAWRVKEGSILPVCRHTRVLWKNASFSYCELCLPRDTSGLQLKRVAFPNVPWGLIGGSPDTIDLPPHAPSCPGLEVEVDFPPRGSTLWLSRRKGRLPLQARSSPPTPLLWGVGHDTIGWQRIGQVRWYAPPPIDTTLHFWVRVGSQYRFSWCRIKWLP
ncbi:MAG: transglycosylase domain-containing protein [Bacteroidia bacterium]|nr:transglycosylase domain-containing protein [Bacteroidia bacterium]